MTDERRPTEPIAPDHDGETAERIDIATRIMLQLIEDYRERYHLLVKGMHDALMTHARIEAEHDPHFRLNPNRTISHRFLYDDHERAVIQHAKNRVNRKNFLAHELTKALVALKEFDDKYPRS